MQQLRALVMKPGQVLPENPPAYNEIIWGSCWLVMKADLTKATVPLCGAALVVVTLTTLTTPLYLTARTVQPTKCLSLKCCSQTRSREKLILQGCLQVVRLIKLLAW